MYHFGRCIHVQCTVKNHPKFFPSDEVVVVETGVVTCGTLSKF